MQTTFPQHHLLCISSYGFKVIRRIPLLKAFVCNLVKLFHLQHMRRGELLYSDLILEPHLKTICEIKYSQALAFYTVFCLFVFLRIQR